MRLTLWVRRSANTSVQVTVWGLLLASVASCKFEPDIEPLILPDAPPQALQEFSPEQPQVQELAPEEAAPPASFGDLNSEDAIELCQEREFYGDAEVGTCLAPGGESYFVWVTADDVRVVNRGDPFLQAFQFSALNRAANEDIYFDKLQKWWQIPLLVIEGLTVGVTCGGAIGTALTGAGLVVTGPLAGGCVASGTAFGYTADQITRDAQALVDAVSGFSRHEADARYNFCRMEGHSDEECT